MSDDQHGEGMPQGAGRWDPLPQGDYDDGATAFVELPEGGVDALLADSPLAAPGHGYVPPQITVTPATTAGTDPAATGTWAIPADGVQWPDPNAVPRHTEGTGNDRFTYNPNATGQWNFEEPAGAEASPAPGHDVTGQWSIPVAGGDLPDESGEFTTSSLVEQWGGTPPATLPGGAAAPWASETAGAPWGQTPAPEAPDAHRPEGHAPDTHAPEGYAPDTHAVERGAGGHGSEQPGSHEFDASAEQPYPEAPAEQPYAEVSAEQPYPEVSAEQPYAEGSGGPYSEGSGEPYSEGSGAPYAEVSAEQPGPAASQTAHEGREAGDAVEASEEAQEAAEAVEGAAEEAAEPAAEPAPEADAGEGTAEGGGAAEASDGEAAPPPSGEEHPLASYVLRVNGVDRPVTDAWIGESLLYVLRERLGLAGAKDGCSQGECGACNVQVDGRLVASCLVPAVTAAGSEVRTVEGLAADGQPSDVQRALARCGAVQCGFCVPGMAMTLHDLLEGNPAPSEMETRQALCGNLCRCSGYRGVVEAVKEVVAERESHSTAADSEQDGDEARIPHQAGPGAGGVNPSAFEPAEPHDRTYGPGQGQDGGQA
ncbi:2Fe-2S iron-sulfur cluster-binding protein [Streptomyces resistomycificus]|uniref:(2Fe-2S)-binding protein n=1 Tax=Streptomyces resistomycificus TaxID=67356 RepID=A0A0L8LE73_9ACTN|nr:(2Fe-2S)-binding protein [Streptomyces resistomycificus]KOG36415.1 (2Fe-2S)-binding protein [Streptomyces resistomycificus]KUN92464.1 (2Fe-2S)-binding protein [Streptomyces resistomycificus]